MTTVIRRPRRDDSEDNSRRGHEAIKPSKNAARQAAVTWLRNNPGWHPTTAFKGETGVAIGAGSEGDRRMREVANDFKAEFPQIRKRMVGRNVEYRYVRETV